MMCRWQLTFVVGVLVVFNISCAERSSLVELADWPRQVEVGDGVRRTEAFSTESDFASLRFPDWTAARRCDEALHQALVAPEVEYLAPEREHLAAIADRVEFTRQWTELRLQGIADSIYRPDESIRVDSIEFGTSMSASGLSFDLKQFHADIVRAFRQCVRHSADEQSLMLARLKNILYEAALVVYHGIEDIDLTLQCGRNVTIHDEAVLFECANDTWWSAIRPYTPRELVVTYPDGIHIPTFPEVSHDVEALLSWPTYRTPGDAFGQRKYWAAYSPRTTLLGVIEDAGGADN